MRSKMAAALLVILATAGATGLAQRRSTPPDAATLQQVMNAWETLDPAKAGVFYAKDQRLVFYDFLPRKYTGWAAHDKGVREGLRDARSLSMNVANDAEADNRMGVQTWDRLCDGAWKIKCAWPTNRTPSRTINK